MKKKRNISISAVMVILIAALLVLKVFDIKIYRTPENVIRWDVINFYSYLPAAFIEHDLTLTFARNDIERYICSDHYWPEILPDSSMVIKTTMGLSLLYSPFFLVANVLAEPLGYTPDGFSPPYALSLLLACVFWVSLGFVYLRKLLLRHFSEVVTTIVLAVTLFATNLYWYSSYEAAYAHGFLFGLTCIFLWQTERWHENHSWWCTVAAGLNLGLITLIRPTDALVLLYFLLYDVTSWNGLKEKVTMYLQQWPKVVAMAVSTIAMWVPQMIYWHVVTGHLFFFSYTHNERFFWTQPKIIEFLFSFRKGWFIYTPVMVFAILGLIPLYKHYRKYFYPIIFFLIINIYVLSCWWCWWFGGSFGQRSMIDCYGMMAIPMAAFVAWLLKRKTVPRIILIVVFAAISYLSFFHYRQYKHGAIHCAAMTREAYFDSFGHTHPSDCFWSLLDEPNYDAAKQGIR
ncbi:MAG: hypothetical protein J5677_04790 [Bacteroidales bacterium]|nr:hypothetical protein [Bacteroidales bacterium]